MTPPAATAAGRALPRTAAPRAPRRVSGPARPNRRGASTSTGARRRTAAAHEPLAVRALRRSQAMADSRFLARLIGGRLWIPLVAVGLIGIVFMQVSMLRMNADISRSVDTSSALERQNAALRADVSRMESGERIDRVASQLGMVAPADGTDHYVRAGSAQLAGEAAARMTSPDPDAVERMRAAAAGLAAATGASTASPAVTSVQPAAATPTAAPATATATPVVSTGTGTAAPAVSSTPVQTQAATPAPQQTQQTAAPVAATPQPQAAVAATAAGGTAAPTAGQG